jgi:hypothetical protein
LYQSRAVTFSVGKLQDFLKTPARAGGILGFGQKGHTMQLRSGTIIFGGTMVGVLTLAGMLFSGLGQVAFAQHEEQSRDPLAAVSQRSDNPGIEGTWRVTVTQKVCATGVLIGPPFRSLLTFARGGTMTGTTASSAFLPGQRSGDYGVWSPAAGHSYSATEEAFVIFSGGSFTQGWQTISHSITPTNSGNGFNDVASIQFYDGNGNPLLPAPGCATAVGQRLQ